MNWAMTMGVTKYVTATPKLPMPAFRPFAVPFFAMGKKKPMFAMDAEKQESARPMNENHRANVANVVVGSCTAKPRPISGMSRMAVVTNVTFLPPKRAGRYV